MKQLTILFLLLVLTASLSTKESDFNQKLKILYKIYEVNDGSYAVTANTNLTYELLTKRSTELDTYQVVERFYAPISNLHAEKRNDRRTQTVEKNSKSWAYDSSMNVFSSDYKTHYIHIPFEKEIGDRINISYKEKYRELAYLPVMDIYAGNRYESVIFEFSHPQDYDIDYETFFPRKSFEHSLERKTDRKTIIKFENLFLDDELDFFGFNDIYAKVFFTISKTGKLVYPFDMKGLADWFFEDVEYKPVLDEEDKDDLKFVIDEKDDDREKLKIIYEYVRDNFRYIASNENNHSFFPHDVKEILKNGYGDCKDKAYMIKAIANNFGLNVDLVLLNTEFSPDIDYYHFLMYNHMICSFTDSLGTIYMDPTAENCEFGNLPYTDYEKYALILDQENPRKEWISKPNREFDAVLKINSHIDSLKSCDAEITLYNDDFMYAKSLYENFKGVEFENNLSNFLTSYFFKISVDYFKFDSENKNSIKFLAKADLREFVISTETKKYLQRTPFVMFDKDIIERNEDENELHLLKNIKLKLSVNLDTGGYEIKQGKLLLGDKESDYFLSGISQESGKYILNYEIHNNKLRYTDADKKVFILYAKEYMRNKKNMIVLRKGE